MLTFFRVWNDMVIENLRSSQLFLVNTNNDVEGKFLVDFGSYLRLSEFRFLLIFCVTFEDFDKRVIEIWRVFGVDLITVRIESYSKNPN